MASLSKTTAKARQVLSGTKTLRVVLYGRQSTKKQGDRSPDVQLAKMKQYCEMYGHQILPAPSGSEMFFDIASGKRTDRDQFNKALDMLWNDEADCIVVAYLDRFARNTLHFLELLAKLQEHGKYLIALDVNMDTSTAIGRAVATILMSIFTMLREQTEEKTAETREWLKDQGKRYSGRPPYGFRPVYDSETGKPLNQLEENPEEQRVLKVVYQMRIEKFSPTEIAEELNKMAASNPKWQTRHGGTWHCKQIQRILERL